MDLEWFLLDSPLCTHLGFCPFTMGATNTCFLELVNVVRGEWLLSSTCLLWVPTLAWYVSFAVLLKIVLPCFRQHFPPFLVVSISRDCLSLLRSLTRVEPISKGNRGRVRDTRHAHHCVHSWLLAALTAKATVISLVFFRASAESSWCLVTQSLGITLSFSFKWRQKQHLSME